MNYHIIITSMPLAEWNRSRYDPADDEYQDEELGEWWVKSDHRSYHRCNYYK